MNTLKRLFGKHAVAVTVITLIAGWGLASAAEDQFMVDLGRHGKIIRGGGTGFNDGAWYYYPHTGQSVQWFYNGAVNLDNKKVVEVELTVRVLDPGLGKIGTFEASVNWTRATWPEDQNTPPLPDTKKPWLAPQYIQETVVVPRTSVLKPMTVKATVEIPEFCPEWVSIDIRGENITVEGLIRHECVPKISPKPPTEDRDFGDAPEGVVAYPAQKTRGEFPTCVEVGPAAWIEHAGKGQMYFGRKVDIEREGNAGACPLFTPDAYDRDEGMSDSDAGLIRPRAYTIKGSAGHEDVYPLIFTSLEFMSSACLTAIWEVNVDIEVHNKSQGDAYVNVLMDWNHDGRWGGASPCNRSLVPEHVLVNFPVPAGYQGPLSALTPPNFTVGPVPGYVWARFTISERPVLLGWTGAGVFADGETEDYMFQIMDRPPVCSWRWDEPHLMHWAQLPDTKSTGIDVDLLGSSLADDFSCEEKGPIGGIHFWGSFKDDVTPVLGVDSLTFEVNIYSNAPADMMVPWSRPDLLLWTGQISRFSYDVSEISNNVKEDWFEPTIDFYDPNNHKRTFQYDICLDPDETLFVPTLGETYWLEIKEIPGLDNSYAFGWKTTKHNLQYNDAAVWYHPILEWLPMTYPTGHEYDGDPLDLAFVVTGLHPKWAD